MTEKSYLEDSYTTFFTAHVLSCTPCPNGRYEALLDHTFFYPQSGGQLADSGMISGVDVVDVRERTPDDVVHVLSGPIPTGLIEAQVDWKRRFDHMQQHTGQHVLSRAFVEVAGLETVAFHMGTDTCTIDVAGGEPTPDVVDAAERLANRIVSENRPVGVRTVPRAELKAENLRRSIPAHVDEVRLVEVGEFDVIGCCGTHVRATGELAIIKILKNEKAKGAHRIFFKAGGRAVADYRIKHDLVRDLALRFTTGEEGIAGKLDKMESELHDHRKTVKQLAERLAAEEAKSLMECAEDWDGLRCVVVTAAEAVEGYAQALATQLRSHTNTVGIVASSDGRVVCVASRGIAIDLAGLIAERTKALGGRGGGKGGFATVQLPTGADADEFAAEVGDIVKEWWHSSRGEPK